MPDQGTKTVDAPHYDGVQRRALIVLAFIDAHLAAHNGEEPDFKAIRKAVEHESESSVWTYLFSLEQGGHIDLQLTNRAPTISRRLT